MADDKIDEVVRLLRRCNDTQLTQVCGNLGIAIPEEKAGKKTSIFNLILRFLTSEAMEQKEDAGLADMLKLGDDLEAMGVKESKVEPSNADGGSKQMEVKTQVSLAKLREFKITGGNVGGGENCLDYMSLSYQIQEGKAHGYSTKEIKGGVIRAIKGGSLRRYLEGRPDISEENFIKILRTHYNVKDSTTLFNEMSNAVQETTETELNYTLRMMDLRNNVLTLSREESCAFEENMLKRKFFHSLSVGFRKDTIRIELQNVLKNHDQTDEDLLREISLVVAKESEHAKKLKKSASVNHVGTGSLDSGDSAKLTESSKILEEISKLTVRVNELSSVKGEVKELRKQISNGIAVNGENVFPGSGQRGGNSLPDVQTVDGGGRDGRRDNNYRNSRRTPFIKCESCQRTKAFCTHCSRCGAADHKRKDCSKNQ